MTSWQRRSISALPRWTESADLDDPGTGGNRLLLDVAAVDRSHAAGEHDRLVVAPEAAVGLNLKGAEEAGQLRTPKLVAEACAADRTVDHDVERRRETRREGLVGRLLLPCALCAGEAEVGDHETGKTGLAAAAGAGGAFVADFAADAGRSAGERGYGGRVVVRLDLHQEVELALAVFVALRPRIYGELLRLETLDYAGIVLVGDERPLRMGLVGRFDHAEERRILRRAVDGPLGVEYLVAAVLGVHLAEHDEFGVGGIASRALVGLFKVCDFVVAHREAECGVGLFQCGAALGENVEGAAGCRRALVEEIGEVGIDALGHAVVDGVQRRCQRGERKRVAAPVGNGVVDPALDALHLGAASDGEDLACLG